MLFKLLGYLIDTLIYILIVLVFIAGFVTILLGDGKFLVLMLCLMIAYQIAKCVRENYRRINK